MTMEYNNDGEGLEFLLQQLAEIDGLRLMASDVRTGEEEGSCGCPCCWHAMAMWMRR